MATTPEQQLFLEMMNRARANPAGEFDELVLNAGNRTGADSNITNALRYFSVDMALLENQLNSYDAVAPLAWNDSLAQSALTHTNLMISTDTQAHYLPGEPGLIDRMAAAGYTGARSVSENIYAYAESILYAHAGYFIDWGGGPGGIQDPAGHRENIMNSLYTEVGVAWVAENNGNTSVGPYLSTQHFATTWGYDPQLLGVVIDDADGDDFYDIGEGMGGVTVTATSGDVSYTTTSWASGGYQMELPTGTWDITFAGGDLNGEITATVTIRGENVKLDGFADQASAPSTIGRLVVGTAGSEELAGTDMDDTLEGGTGEDTLDGGAGDDLLKGGKDADTLMGGGGDDLLRGQGHGDLMEGGEGADNIKGGGGNDTLYGDGGDDYLKGGTRKDVLGGGAGNDKLFGNSYDDVLIGDAGDDTLNAGGENDRLDGGTGDDWMKGGTGDDVFVFDIGHGSDIIVDWGDGADVLEISLALADGQSTAQIAASADITAAGVEISLAAGDVILLQGLSDTSGLAAMIDLV